MSKIYISRTNALSEQYFNKAFVHLRKLFPNSEIVYYNKNNHYHSTEEIEKRKNVTLHILAIESGSAKLGKGVYHEYIEEFANLDSYLLYERKSTLDFQFYEFTLTYNGSDNYLDYCNLLFGDNKTVEVCQEMQQLEIKHIRLTNKSIPVIPISRIRFIMDYYKTQQYAERRTIYQ